MSSLLDEALAISLELGMHTLEECCALRAVSGRSYAARSPILVV